MNNLITKMLKIIISVLVVVCLFLCVFISSDFEDLNSIMSVNSMYNVVPYVEEDNIGLLNDVDVLDTFIGTITAYGPDCVGCSGITASGYKVAENIGGVIKSITTTYNDETFGELRVLASANTFPFGTIMRITGDRIDGQIMGIVLDRGGAMNNAWGDGEVLIDLLFATENSSEVYEFGRQKNVKFEILRYGR